MDSRRNMCRMTGNVVDNSLYDINECNYGDKNQIVKLDLNKKFFGLKPDLAKDFL